MSVYVYIYGRYPYTFSTVLTRLSVFTVFAINAIFARSTIFARGALWPLWSWWPLVTFVSFRANLFCYSIYFRL